MGRDRAIKALYDGAIKKKVGAGMASLEQFRAIGVAARADHGRASLTAETALENRKGSPTESTKNVGEPTPTPGPVTTHGDYGQRTVDPAVLEAAERARAEREAAAERQALQDAEDREVGLDPRSLQTLEKPTLDVVKEAETFATLTNALADSAQALEVWIRGKLNAYGSPFFDSMQEFALGINTAHGRLDQIRYADERLQRVILLLESDVEPGDLTNPTGYQQEPS
jgi:hypothetical protein